MSPSCPAASSIPDRSVRSAGLALTGASLSSFSWAHGAAALWAARQPTIVLAAEADYVEGVLVRNGRVNTVMLEGTGTAALAKSSASQLARLGRMDSFENVRIVVHGARSADVNAEPVRLPLDGAPAGAPSAFGAVASALLGLGRSGFLSNVIPPGARNQRSHAQLIPTYALLFLVTLTLLAAWAREPYQQLVYAERLDAEIQRLRAGVDALAAQESRLNQISEKMTALDGLVRGGDANLEALRELARILPPDTWLNSYQYQDGVLTLSGLSGSAGSVQKIIEDSSVFSGAQFTSSITRDVSGRDRFTIRTSFEGRQ